MIRFAILVCCYFTAGLVVHADPVKAEKPADAKTLAKNCATAWVTAVQDGKGDEAVALMVAPFRSPENKKLDTLNGFAAAFSRKMPAGIETKITDVVALDDFNKWLIKNEAKTLDEDTLKEYRDYLGPKDGQIAIFEMTVGARKQKTIRPPHYLVRIKDGKAALVGINSGK
jgi:hypothetical protein